MGPLEPPPGAASSAAPSTATSNTNRRRRPDLNLSLPQRDPAFAVPLAPSPNFAPSPTRNRSIYPSDLRRLNPIGNGNTLYNALHSPTGRLYALKVNYPPNYYAVHRRIRREIEILRSIDDPNVVKCHEVFDKNGEIQVLLELMDGGSLEKAHIPQEDRLSQVTSQLLSGLAYLHRRKFAHRNIKPSNLLVNTQNEVKIAEFTSVLTQSGKFSVEAIAYMSPERISADCNFGIYDGFSGDIWSLGLSVLEIYLGKCPFLVKREGDWASMLSAICMSQPPEAPHTATPEFRHFVACCLQSDPVRRWTAEELLKHPFVLKTAITQR